MTGENRMIKTDLDFPTTRKYGKEQVKYVQNRLLEMALIATNILDKNGFKYCIAYGTLLGAIRHNGFIPWDDDFDIYLFDDEYDAAVQCLRNNLPSDIVVHDKMNDPIYWPAWSRLRDLNTECFATLYPDDNAYKYRGINLDLYRIKKVDISEVLLYRKRENIEFLCRKKSSGLLSEEAFIKMFNQWTKEYNKLLNGNQNKTEYREVYTFCADNFYFEKDDILPLRKYTFENCTFYGPNNPDNVLKKAFGDYMTIPEYNKRMPHYDNLVIYKKR